MTPRALLDRLLSGLGRFPRRPGGPRGRGWDWERQAERHLIEQGYRILERGARLGGAEIDLVAEERGVLCFVEVKGRSGTRFGLPEESVDTEKRRRLTRAAQAYLRRQDGGARVCRFDVVTVLETASGPRIEILRDAFEAEDDDRG